MNINGNLLEYVKEFNFMEHRYLIEVLTDKSEGRQLKNLRIINGMKNDLHASWSARVTVLNSSPSTGEMGKYFRYK